MRPSLRFVLALVASGALAAPISYAVLRRHATAETRATAEALTRGSVAAGRLTFARHGCGSCHAITGVPGASGAVGPALDGVAVRSIIAGKLANAPENMVHWLREPQAIVPGNAMPDQDLTEQEARDVSAYLYTLR
jgi:cytochrome c